MLRRSQTPPPGTTTRGRAAGALLLALVLATVLDAGPLLKTAKGMPYGWRRDVAVAVMQPVERMARAGGLDAPHRALDRLLGRETAAPPSPVPQPVPTTAPSPTPAASPTPARVPSAADPLRIAVVGDSMAQATGQSLIRMAAATGVATARLDFRFSSGLTRPDFFDWPGHLLSLMSARRAPEAVVVVFGANDAQGMESGGSVLRFGTPAWDAAYLARVDGVMQLLTDHGAHVWWVGQPIARSSSYAARMKHLDGLYARAAQHHPGVTFVDTWPLFTTEDGRYADYLPTSSGLERMRIGDGIHLTRAGGDRLARVVLGLIGKDWRLSR